MRPINASISCMSILLEHERYYPLRSDSLDEVLEPVVVTVFFILVNSNEELTDEVVSVSTESVLNVPSSFELSLRLLRVFELFGVRVIRVLKLVVRSSGWTATRAVVVAAKVVNSHCSNLGVHSSFFSSCV